MQYSSTRCRSGDPAFAIVKVVKPDDGNKRITGAGFVRWVGFTAAMLMTVVHAGTLSGEVVGVTDGDTITLLDRENRQIKVRLAGIDAPEKRQPFGQKSKASLSELTYRKTVTVTTGKNDRYRRVVGKLLADGQDVNLEQVRRGMAWHYKAYEREQSAVDRVTYAAEEDVARNLKRGLWSMPGAQPPWEFRRHGAVDPARIAGHNPTRSGQVSAIRRRVRIPFKMNSA
jgi:endonuclease YncB( thermonuclease family)